MAQSRASKKFMNMAYGLGAAIVIIGALFKITHFELGPLNGNVMLTLGLVTEAIIFAISAFEPVDDDLDWSLVYPELAGGATSTKQKDQPKDAEGLLSKKLDELLKDYDYGNPNPDLILGQDGIIQQLRKRILERALKGEMTHHLGYEKSSKDGYNTGNSRNGTSSKKVLTRDGELDIDRT